MGETRENVEVIVGNVGTVYLGFSILRGYREFKECVLLSKENYGRMGGEPVILMVDGEIEDEHEGSNVS